ncbi:MAG: sodium:proton antiporter, partial [Prevotella sp.]|nr:sodium:proton antiporter [Prevotella sp.]
ILPCLVAWAVPTALMSRMLPERLDLESYTLPYRGDDTNLQLWQRILMFFFSIAGLWFIPIFHNITRLSPFVGALCVLSLLWIVNEIFNRKLIDSGQITHQRPTHLLQDSLIQTMLYVMGIMLIMGILIETGAGHFVGRQAMLLLGDVWTIAIAPFIAGMVSLVLDPFASAATFFSLYDIQGTEYLMQNGEYWISIAYATAVGSTILGIGSLSGLAMFKMRSTTIGWYVKYASPKIFLGALLGLLVLIAEAVVF